MNAADVYLPEWAEQQRADPINQAIEELHQYYLAGRLSYLEYYNQSFRLQHDQDCTCPSPLESTCPACRATARRVYGGEV